MDYLKSFVIGSSALVTLNHVSLLSIANKDIYDYSVKIYSLLAPVYYGLMAMLALYLKKIYKLSLQKSLFIASIISIIFVVSINYFISRYRYKPYKNYTNKEWLKYIIDNGTRHLVNFNIIIYLFEKYFSVFYPLKVFIIGSSVLAYFLAFLKVQWLTSKGKTSYTYELFAVAEPMIQGLGLVFWLFVYGNIFGFNLKSSLFLWVTLGSLIWLITTYTLKVYLYNNKEWGIAYLGVLVTRTIKSFILYYLLTNLH